MRLRKPLWDDVIGMMKAIAQTLAVKSKCLPEAAVVLTRAGYTQCNKKHSKQHFIMAPRFRRLTYSNPFIICAIIAQTAHYLQITVLV